MKSIELIESNEIISQTGRKPDLTAGILLDINIEELKNLLGDLLHDEDWWNPLTETTYLGTDKKGVHHYKQTDHTIPFLPMPTNARLEIRKIDSGGFDIIISAEYQGNIQILNKYNLDFFSYICHHQLIPQEDGTLLLAIIGFNGLVSLPGIRKLASKFYLSIYNKALLRLKEKAENGSLNKFMIEKNDIKLIDEA